MKVSAFLCTYDDCEFLDQTLESFKWYPDKLYIIEGAWQSAQGYRNSAPRSSVETYNIIDKHVDNKKVFLIQANEPRERDQRQIGLEKAKEDGADFCWMLDSDEVYPRKLLSFMDTILKNNINKASIIHVESYNFINGFTKWYEGKYKRIFRPTRNAKFYMDNDVDHGNDLDNVMFNRTNLFCGARFYHYNYVKQRDAQFWRKMHYQNEQDPTFNTRLLPQYASDGAGHYKIPDDIPIYNFTGKHPAIMKHHPYFKNNIYNETGIRFQS